MSDENFFVRWSRRKAEAEKADAADRSPPEKAPEQSPAAAAPPPAPPAQAAPAVAATDSAPFDLKDLPSIDSISAGTDVSVFLRPGVPAELARAALRRAWSTDPAIRDYIGLSENAWDFTAPHGVPGFGPLSADDVNRLMAAFTGQLQAAEKLRSAQASESPAPGLSEHAPPSTELAAAPADFEPAAQNADDNFGKAQAGPSRLPQREDSIAAPQHIQGDRSAPGAHQSPIPRRHGRALPK